MRYNAGDRVRIKSKEWWDAQPKNEIGSVECGPALFTVEMARMCGRVVTIEHRLTQLRRYRIKGHKQMWNDDMIEGLVEDKPTLSESRLHYIANAIKNNNIIKVISSRKFFYWSIKLFGVLFFIVGFANASLWAFSAMCFAGVAIMKKHNNF